MERRLIPTTLVKLKEIENDDELAGGTIERRVLEECRAICSDCSKYVSDWVSYDEALSTFIRHRQLYHRQEKAVARPL